MIPSPFRRAMVAICLIASATCPCASLLAKPHVQRPRLVVLISIDQFRFDYLERFRDLFVPGGFLRLTRGGAHFINARFTHIPTYTAPGHAVMSTGAQPSGTGIVGNRWYDRETGRSVTSVEDPATRLLGGSRGIGASPHRLLTDTIGDELRISSNNQSRVVSVSLKDRSAVLMGGKTPNGAFWFDDDTGTFVSSDYYFKSLPEWVRKFNEARPADRFFHETWKKLLPEPAYARSGPDDSLYEYDREGSTRTFPHGLRRGLGSPGPDYYKAVVYSPYGNELVLGLAREAVNAESLGRDLHPDLLCIGLSSNDLVGHMYGPYSHEVEDITLRTDRMLAAFLRFLDAKVGMAKYLVVLTSDHGIAPIPEYAAEHRLNGRHILPATVRETIDRALDDRFGEANWVSSLEEDNVYLDYRTLADKHVELPVAAEVAGEAAMKIPGMARYFTRATLARPYPADDFVARAAANGYHPERSGDVLLVPAPFTVQMSTSIRTTHGSPHSYDTHVPLIFFGAPVKPGRFPRACGPIDIAPTLAAILGIEKPASATGQILAEALR